MEYARLIEFLCELLDIQIKKYQALTRIGVGPDAGMNAKLVLDQVEELLQFTNVLLFELENPRLNSQQDDLLFENIFNQVRFYIEQEYLRGYAGWLIDENNVHTPEFERLKLQKAQLAELADEAQINIAQFASPVTATQKQCQHDSHEIAYLILDLAVKLKENPEMELDEKIPPHARRILRAHVADSDGRYHQDDIWFPLIGLHERCRSFLSESTLHKSTAKLTRMAAEVKVMEHYDALEKILYRLQEIHPLSSLFSPDHQWYSIATKPQSAKKTEQPAYGYDARHFALFGSVAAAAVGLIYYLIQDSDNIASFNLKL